MREEQEEEREPFKPKKPPKEKKKRCQHIRQRKVVGSDGKILWFECMDCRYDSPLRV
jgi:hypothetical protein